MKGKRIAKGVAAAVVLMSLAACKDPGDAANRGAAQESPRAQVSVVMLRAQAVPLTTELSGRVVASLEAEVRPQVTGIIQKRLFREGGEVKAGEALYQIDPATYQAAYDSARAALVKAEAAVPGALAKADRYSDLVRRNAVSKQEYEDAADVLAQARANVAVAKAAVETARIALDYTTIRAPISGRIDRSSLTPGALVTAGQAVALTTIRQIDPINVDLTQSSASLLALREAIESGRLQSAGSGVGVRLKLENGTPYPYAGKLEFAESSVNQATGTYVLRAVLRNPARLLLPGMYVRAWVDEGTAPHAFLIPQRAVSRGLRGEATALFVRNGKVVEQTLTGARQVGNDWLVQTGVADGDQVIVEGSQLVREGDAVTAVHVELDKATGAVRPTRAVARADNADSPGATRPALIRDRQASRS